MVNIAIFASGNGSNFENIVNAIQNGTIKDTNCAILIVDKPQAYAIERAKKLGIPYRYVDPKAYGGKAGIRNRNHENLKGKSCRTDCFSWIYAFYW